MNTDSLEEQIKNKYHTLGESPDTYLKGLLYQKPVDYWDYVQVDTLLSLQKPRTDFKDEFIFIAYHQVTELTLRMMLHEIKQVVEVAQPDEAFLIQKLDRLIRYTEMLINSFSIMKEGMDYHDYNTFRHALAPASGFQSVQFRYIELHCTRLTNLLRKDEPIDKTHTTTESMFEHLYWKTAGFNKETGGKTLTLKRFEEKYQVELIRLAEKMKGHTMEDKIRSIKNPQTALIEKLKTFDYLYNVKWPQVHLETAQHYLDQNGETKAATGGSPWKKYLNPKFQQRCFFPTLWEANEFYNWENKTPQP